MNNNSVLIITNDSEKGVQISSKIKLLRECDTIQTVTYIEVISVLNTNQPKLIILYCSKNDSVEIVKEIRNINTLDDVPILLIMDTKDDEKLFYAFDNGIDDFVFLDDDDSIILMRILLTLQKSILYKELRAEKNILIADNILDKQTNMYTKEKAPIVLRNFFSESIEENYENTVFMYIKPVAKDNMLLNIHSIANIIKSVPRGNDIAAFAKESGFYMVLYNAGEKGANAILNRIQEKAGDNCIIYGCATEVNAAFEELEPILYRALKEQISTKTTFNFLKNINIADIDIIDENGKSFKDFKKEFINGFEKIVAPVFYQLQNAYGEKFPKALISYYINETESCFSIKQNKESCELKITYPSYIKIIIDVKQIPASKNPKVKRLTFDLEDFSQEKLIIILEDMINEYLSGINMSIIEDELRNE